ncbi:cation transporter [Jeotgalibacillus alimentarius]|uniref:Cation transporter n=1 Tax=Jeotgalibacillus alimentarius TaxID=135826 RepID=A0A0C2S455_9BACL|nr:ion transporter [Jeotgalibacillus alimentarius]KIL48814.1 cation transporter [Jeotgalibacillus alimentarius]
MDRLKKQLVMIAEHSLFNRVIIGLILLNALLIGLETYPILYDQYGDLFVAADRILLWIFTVEIVIRLIASTSVKSFFKEPWNVFDFVIVLSGHLITGGHYVTVLRILRVLRVLRTISVIPSLRKMVNALLMTIPSMGTILLLLSILFYIYGVIGTMLYSEIAPEYFGSLHSSLLTLFQVVTLESWASGVMRPILAEDPTSWWYFVTFVLIGTFVFFNLFVGVIVNNVEEADKENRPSPEEVKLSQVQKELEEIKAMIKNQKE